MSESFPCCLEQEDDALQHVLSLQKCLNYAKNGVHAVAITFPPALRQMCHNMHFLLGILKCFTGYKNQYILYIL